MGCRHGKRAESPKRRMSTACSLEAPLLQPTLEFMAKLGAPWIFGSDTPATLVEHRGWTATVTDAAEPGNRWNRWMHPAVPADVPGVPCGYFVEAIKA